MAEKLVAQCTLRLLYWISASNRLPQTFVSHATVPDLRELGRCIASQFQRLDLHQPDANLRFPRFRKRTTTSIKLHTEHSMCKKSQKYTNSNTMEPSQKDSLSICQYVSCVGFKCSMVQILKDGLTAFKSKASVHLTTSCYQTK